MGDIMSLFDSILNKAGGIGSDLLSKAKNYLNKDLMNGTMAALAMVACANGNVEKEEKQKLTGIIRRSELLNSYNIHEVLNAFDRFVSEYEFDADVGEGECLKAISKITEFESKQLLIRECIAIGKADGEFDEDEKAVVIKICKMLRVEPGLFNL